MENVTTRVKATDSAREQIYQEDCNNHGKKTDALGCYTVLRQEQTPEGRLPFSVMNNMDSKEQ